jgi:O-antigen/teichoic acid export membrane protein
VADDNGTRKSMVQVRASDTLHAARSGGMQILTVLGQATLPLAQVVVARLFGATVFGAYQASVALIEVLLRGGTGGADKAMLRYVAAFRARQNEAAVVRTIGTGLRLCLLVSGILSMALLVNARWVAALLDTPLLTTSLTFMAPAVLVTALIYVLVQASLAAKVTWPNLLVRGLGEPVFLLVAALGAALWARTLGGLAVAHAVAETGALALALWATRRAFGAGTLVRALRAPSLPRFARFALPVGMGELLNAILQRADVIMLTAFAGPTPAGIYAAAEFLGRSIAGVRYAFDSVAAAVLSETVQLDERLRLRHNLQLMTRWVTSVAAPVAALMIILRRELLALYGPQFRAGATVMIILALSHFFNASLGLGQWVLMVSGRAQLMLLNNLGCAALNVGLGLVLIPRWGMVGTGLAVLAAFSVMQVLVLTENWRAERVHPFHRALIKPLLAATIVLVLGILVSPTLGGLTRIFVVGPGGLLVYVGCLVALRLPSEDRLVLSRVWQRIARRS